MKRVRRLAAFFAMCVFASVLSVAGTSQVGAQTGECTTNTYGTADDAKANYANDCGQPFEQTTQFRCDWVPGGWQCSGPGSSTSIAAPVESPTAEPQQSDPTPADDTSTPTSCADGKGGVYGTADDAKANYESDCGQPFRNTTAYRCDWVPGGWQCSGPVTDTTSTNVDDNSSVDPVATASFGTPNLSQPVVKFGHLLSMDWPAVANAAKYNVYRNGSYLRTVPSNVFAQTQHPAGTHNFAVAAVHSDGTTISPLSNLRTITVVQNPLNVRASVNGSDDVTVSWSGSTSAQQYRVFRNGIPVMTQSSNQFVDANLPMGDYEYVIYGLRTDGSSISLPSQKASVRVGTKHITLNARSSGSDSVLSWSKPAGVTTATVTVFGQPDSNIVTSMLATDATTLTLPSTGAGFMVSYGVADKTIATSGFVTPTGTCISLCNADQLEQAATPGPSRVTKEDGTILFDAGFGPPDELEITNSGNGIVTVDYGNSYFEMRPDGKTYLVNPNGSRELIDGPIDPVFDSIPGPPPFTARVFLEYVIEGIIGELGEANLEHIELEKLRKATPIPMPYFQERTLSGTNSRSTDPTTGVTSTVTTIEDGQGNATTIAKVSTPDTSAASSPRTNVTKVYYNGTQIGEDFITVTSPTGGTYSQSRVTTNVTNTNTGSENTNTNTNTNTHNVPNPGVCCDTTTTNTTTQTQTTEPETTETPGHNVPNPGVCC